MAEKQGSSGANVKAAASSQQVVKCSRIASLSLSASPWAMGGGADHRVVSAIFAGHSTAGHLPFDPDLLGMALLTEWMDRMLKLGYSHQFCAVNPPFMAFSEELIIPLRG